MKYDTEYLDEKWRWAPKGMTAQQRFHCIVFKYVLFFSCSVTGGELFHYLAARDRVNEDEAVEFLLQILKGVKHMHQKSIVHLDLKVRLQILKGVKHMHQKCIVHLDLKVRL